MYGRIFESLYRGSMVGSGSPTFAVWGYVIANMRADEEVGAQVELNPKLLAFILGEKQEVVEEVIAHLCAPDPGSTSKEKEGRRLVRMGEFAYQVVNGAKYMSIKNEEARREYFRDKKRESRAEKAREGNGKSIPSGESIRAEVIRRVNEDPITKADQASMRQLDKKEAVKLGRRRVVEEYDLGDPGDHAV